MSRFLSSNSLAYTKTGKLLGKLKLQKAGLSLLQNSQTVTAHDIRQMSPVNIHSLSQLIKHLLIHSIKRLTFSHSHIQYLFKLLTNIFSQSHRINSNHTS